MQCSYRQCTEDAEYRDGKCVRHSRDEFKSVAAFNAALDADFRSGRSIFPGYVFPDDVDFSGLRLDSPICLLEARFIKSVNFSHAVLPHLTLLDVEFGGTALFTECRIGLGSFERCRFAGAADFRGCTFGSSLHMERCEFNSPANLSRCTIPDEARMEWLRFAADADFSSTRFGDGCWLTGWETHGRVDFRHVCFGAKTKLSQIRMGEPGGDFSHALFGAGAELRHCAIGVIAFENVVFGQDAQFERTYLAGAAFPFSATVGGVRARLKKALDFGEQSGFTIEVLRHPDVADRDSARRWALDLLQRLDWVILDTETTGLGGWPEVVQIGLLAPNGIALLDTLVRPMLVIPPDATAIHGITNGMVADAPTFDQVFPWLGSIVSERVVVCYNAEYDANAMHNSAQRFGISVLGPHERFPLGSMPWRFQAMDTEWQCAMRQYASYYGEWSIDHNDYRYQKLPGAGHSAIEDCRSTLRLIQSMAWGTAPTNARARS